MRKFLKNQKGVTMMEVLVTVALLAIVVVPCLSSFVMAQKGNVLAAQTYNEYTAAQNLMEELKSDGDAVTPDTLDALCENKYPEITAVIIQSSSAYFTVAISGVESEEEILRGVVIITP